MMCASREDEQEAASQGCHPCRVFGRKDCSSVFVCEFHDLKRTVSQSACRAGPGTSVMEGRSFRHGCNSPMLVERTYLFYMPCAAVKISRGALSQYTRWTRKILI